MTHARRLARHLIHAFILLLAVSAVSGCAATGPQYAEAMAKAAPPGDGQGRLFFLRKSAFQGGAMSARIHVNGNIAHILHSGGFVFLDVDAGTTDLKVDTGQIGNVGQWTATTDVKPGEQQYYLVSVNMDRNWLAAIKADITDTEPPDAPFKVTRSSERLIKDLLPKLKLSESGK